MLKKIKNLLILQCIFGFGSLALILVFAILHIYSDTPNFYIFYYVFIIVFLVYLIGFIFYTVYSLNKILKTKNENAIKAVDIVSSDVEEAYQFGQIGLILTDKNDTVIWVSEYLHNDFDILDMKITDCNSEFAKLKNSQVTSITIYKNNRPYKVEYIPSANLYILKDNSEIENVYNLYNNERPVVGYLILDNYQEVQQTMDEAKFNEILLTTRKTLVDFFKPFKALLKLVRSDTYFFIIQKKHFDNLINTHFSILDEVKQIDKDGFTISIGLSFGTSDFITLSDLANKAIEVALSRGGDQACVAPYNMPLAFYGGKTELRSSTNKVKLRMKADSLILNISHARRVLIMGHRQADFDAIGACFAVKAICDSAEIPSRIVFEEKLVDYTVRRVIKAQYDLRDKIFIQLDEIASFFEEDEEYEDKETTTQISPNEKHENGTLVVIVDCNSRDQAMVGKLIPSDSNIIVIDHHIMNESTIKNTVFTHIDVNASSTCEILASFMQQATKRIPIDEKTANLMLSGILLDTNHYRNKTTSLTFDASSYLRSLGASPRIADNYLKEDMDVFLYKTKLIADAQTPVTDVMLCIDDSGEIVDSSLLAIVAQEAVAIRGTKACFVLGRVDQATYKLSARSDGSINCQQVIEKFRMGGGGHFSAAAVTFSNMDLDEIINIVKTKITEYIPSATISNSEIQDD